MNKTKPLVFLLAGEPSGDLLGGSIMAALKDETNGNIAFAGVGGEKMESEGINSLFPIEDISLMGIFELLPHAGRLYRRINETVEAIRKSKPDILLTIDSPGFVIAVLKRLPGSTFPKIHYVAPSIWAWRPKRVNKFLGRIDHLLCLLPFEPKLFEEKGLSASFVGHPVLERRFLDRKGVTFRARFGIGSLDMVLGVFPGSRNGELRRHIPIFLETTTRLVKKYPNLKVVIPTLPSLQGSIVDACKKYQISATIISKEEDRLEAMTACNFGLAASGTVALELVEAGVPSVIGYHANFLTELLASVFVKVRFVNLCNILADEEIIPERIMSKCRSDILCEELIKLVNSKEAAKLQIKKAKQQLKKLRPGCSSPSQRAAKTVLSYL
ncbi:MAG: lipid-A-disaccharide synthase [Pseudomonadota bacterium]|nr:lipid-A-disaccharide synthase [Pseudomonadota bacterium]